MLDPNNIIIMSDDNFLTRDLEVKIRIKPTLISATRDTVEAVGKEYVIKEAYRWFLNDLYGEVMHLLTIEHFPIRELDENSSTRVIVVEIEEGLEKLKNLDI